MARPPDVNPEDIRKALLANPGKTRAEVAKILSEKLGKPVAAELIRRAINRHREWEIPAAKPPGPDRAMDYLCEACLGPIEDVHRKSHHWTMLTAYERVLAGLLDPARPTAVEAVKYVQHRRTNGLVTDYHPAMGFDTRPALPWELDAQSYLKMPPPEYARLEIETALLDPGLAGHVRKYWQAWFETHATRVQVTVKGSG